MDWAMLKLMIMDVPTMSYVMSSRPKYLISVMKDTMSATLLKAEAVPCFTAVRAKLKLSWLTQEKKPIIRQPTNPSPVSG